MAVHILHIRGRSLVEESCSFILLSLQIDLLLSHHSSVFDLEEHNLHISVPILFTGWHSLLIQSMN